MPVREGRVCTYSSTDEVMGITAETMVTRKYTDVREESDGTHFALEGTTETATSAEEQYGEAEGLPSVVRDGVARTRRSHASRRQL